MPSNLDKRYQTMVVLWFSLLASVGMYLLVALFVAPQHANEPQNSSSHLMIVVLLAAAGIAFHFPRRSQLESASYMDPARLS